jgi:hypothetical protein
MSKHVGSSLISPGFLNCSILIVRVCVCVFSLQWTYCIVSVVSNITIADITFSA